MNNRLAPELTDGLTTWAGPSSDVGGDVPMGAQVRTEHCHLDADTLVASDERTFLYLALEDADRATEDGRPFRLDAPAARQLRDLLNVATARGYLS